VRRAELLRARGRRRAICVLAIAAIRPPLAAAAQSASSAPRAQVAVASSIPAAPILRSIAAAEAEGSRWSPRTPIDSVRTYPLGSWGPLPARRCLRSDGTTADGRVVDSTARAIRTGDFVVPRSAPTLRAGQPYRGIWQPLHDPTFTASGLLVRGARIDSNAGAGDTLRFVLLQYVWSAGRSPRPGVPPVMPPGQRPEPYFLDSFTLPSAGTWLLVMTAGEDWGCAIMVADS
jgi:hypothetical protein